MGRKSRNKPERRIQKDATHGRLWEDSAGIHTSFIVPGDPPPGFAKRMSENFQKGIRNAPIWKQMVDRFGEKEAERLLKKCKAGIK
jgi:hypothetical protein